MEKQIEQQDESELSYDFLICISMETTEDVGGTSKSEHKFLYLEPEIDLPPQSFKSEDFPNIIEIDWYRTLFSLSFYFISNFMIKACVLFFMGRREVENGKFKQKKGN